MLSTTALFSAGVYLGIICGIVEAAVAADRVDPLPGFVGTLPSAHYSGYIPVGSLTNATGMLHYWFIESENDPKTDPVLLWLNGGPGSSSLIGLLTENGQMRSDDASLANPVPDGAGSTIPQLFYHPYTWTKNASIIYLESPKGVGFSYCDAPGSTSENCVNDDFSTALDAYEFLATWFDSEHFSEYHTNDFYITGESYAGIYIPMLMDQISVDSLGAGINLKGAAIGNGCWGTTVGTCAHTQQQQEYASAFYYGHGMYSAALRSAMLDACGDWSEITSACQGTLDDMNDQMGDFNVYNVYDECGDDNRRRRSLQQELEGERDGRKKNDLSRAARASGGTAAAAFAHLSAPTVTVETSSSFSISAGGSSTSSYGLNDYACGGHTAMHEYLGSPVVAEALHVLPDTPGMTYHKTAGDLMPLYADLVQRRGYRILIYSGDTDGCVPHTGSETWTRQLNFTVAKDWHQWFASPHADQGLHKAGYAVTYSPTLHGDSGSQSSRHSMFQFVTVNGAGHMVPTYQPGFAEELLRKFLVDEEF